MNLPSFAGKVSPTATNMIRMDHTHVMATFHQYEIDSSPRTKQGLANTICLALEIHAQLLTASKIFCGCSTAFGAPPNTHICPVCLGLPGALPVVNRMAVEFGVRAGLALGCHINEISIFARKNYFYPDLPKGYQISQYERPLATRGVLEFEAGGGCGGAEVDYYDWGTDCVSLNRDEYVLYCML